LSLWQGEKEAGSSAWYVCGQCAPWAGWLRSVRWLTRGAPYKAWGQAPEEAADALTNLEGLCSWAAVLLGRAAGSGAGSKYLLW